MNFNQWLKTQQQIQGAVGDLAREIVTDPDAPDFTSKQHLLDYLSDQGAGRVILDLAAQTWRAYEAVR